MTQIEPQNPPSRSRYYAHKPPPPKPYDERVALSLNDKMTNGRHIFAVGADGRSRWTKRWKDIVVQHCNDLGGITNLSEAQICMVRRASAMTVQLESLEIRMSFGDETVPLGVYCQLSSEMRRLFETIGIHRVAREVNGSEVETYFAPRKPTTDRMRKKAHRP